MDNEQLTMDNEPCDIAIVNYQLSIEKNFAPLCLCVPFPTNRFGSTITNKTTPSFFFPAEILYLSSKEKRFLYSVGVESRRLYLYLQYH